MFDDRYQTFFIFNARGTKERNYLEKNSLHISEKSIEGHLNRHFTLSSGKHVPADDSIKRSS